MCNSFISAINKAEQEQILSIPAQRLIEKLSLLKNRKETAIRRWFWELLQNASDYNEIVSIKLVVENDRVTFMHDGQPFSEADVLNLISPDSNKRDDETHKDNIGKFGTGLVSTHILSSVIHAEGICQIKYGKKYHFSINLDRSSFLRKQDLILAIQKTKEELRTNFTEANDTGGFQTSFSYDLKQTLPTLPELSVEDVDLEYIYEMLPYTLCFMPKVRSVEIEDCCNEKTSFSIARERTTEESIIFKINRNGNSEMLTFACFKHADVSSVFCLNGDEIVPFPKNMTKFFCGLPLVGTEEIGMPFILNSLKFEPTTEREGIELEPGSNEENRNQMKDSIVVYKKILDFIEKRQIKKAYLLTDIRRKYNGTQASSTQFYNLFLSQYKNLVLEHSIVLNSKGKQTRFSEIRLPFKESKVEDRLYSFAKFISPEIMPNEEDYHGWFEATDFQIFSEQKYTLENLANTIESQKNIYAFGKDAQELRSWLYKCVPYFKENDAYVFQRKKLLPNQSGMLCLQNILYLDKELPNELKTIYNQLHDSENGKIENILLDKAYNDLDILSREYRLEELAKEIDKAFAAEYSKNQGNITPFIKSANELYSWIASSNLSKEELASWFPWYYPKRASLIVDMLTENQREQALTIAQSGKMDVLAKLATSDLTNEEILLLIANIKKLPNILGFIGDKVDDTKHADSDTGDFGEEIVYRDLLQKYPKTQGYKVHWESKENNEPRYDFMVTKNDNVICYVDAKTTIRGMANADSIPFFMRMSQWRFLDNLSDKVPYFIARVFKGDKGNIQYVRIMKEDCLYKNA